MAIVIMILGVAIAAFSPLYKLHMDYQETQKTKISIDDITASIGGFRAVNGRYPCPASLTAQHGDANYGREDCSDLTALAPAGTCVNGICREQSERAIPHMDPYLPGNPIVGTPPMVRVGAVPFRELNIDESEAYDGYDNRVMYVVTENLMDDVTFRADQGGIEIVNDATPATPIISPAASAHFLIFSYGKDTVGAYNKSGTRNACTPGVTETENCNTAVNSRYKQAQVRSNTSGSYFDDVMTYFTQTEVPLWQLSTREQGSIMQKPGGDVGMNFLSASDSFIGSAGATTKQAQINGDLVAQDDPTTGTPMAPQIEGDIMTDNLCPSGGLASGDCFSTDLLAGTVNISAGVNVGGGMKCPEDDTTGSTGPYMLGVANGQPICGSQTPIQCPPGEIMTGINPNGEIECAANSSCTTQSVSVCGSNKTLTAGVDGTTHTVTGGLTMSQTFECQNSSWVQTSSAGVCTCAARADQTRNNQACATGFTGTLTQTRSYICPVAGNW
ncbi:MAG TPA: hypothetical protein VHL11_13565, partial [Phototrophicaceae bacterium]|nr:hypothetical protein [Phototrophicaceae bacterium]